jgi:tetratricopeptide (TPR) repeat protein
MKTIITITAFLVCSMLSAQTQYETGMQKALSLWGEGKPTEATALFERIASAEKSNWLPNYYIGMVNTMEAFNPKNKEKVNSLIEKAQNAIDNATLISPNNAEIMVLQALIYTVILVQDPMTNGMKYSGLAMEQYNKALAIDPNNPRVIFSKAEFELGGAKWSGIDTKPICNQIAKSIELFATFKPETAFHPNWGEERAKEALKNCK